MSDSDLNDLRTWADAHVPVGSRTARLVLALLDERSRLLARAGRLPDVTRPHNLLTFADDGCPLAEFESAS